jgi:hypothetical protein
MVSIAKAKNLTTVYVGGEDVDETNEMERVPDVDCSRRT